MSLRLGFAMQRLENSLCQPSSKRVPFNLNWGKIRQQMERDGLRLSSVVPKILPPMVIGLWETITILFVHHVSQT